MVDCIGHIFRPRGFPLSGSSELFCERCGMTYADRLTSPNNTTSPTEAVERPNNKATLREVYDWLRGLSDSEFAVIASGEDCEDALSLIVGAIGRALDATPQAPADLVERSRRLLVNVASLMDAWKAGAPKEWTTWDEEQRNELTSILKAIAAIPPAGGVAQVRLDALCDGLTGRRYFDVERTEQEDDGTLTAVVIESDSRATLNQGDTA